MTAAARVDVERPAIAGRPSWDQVQYWQQRGRRAADAAHTAATTGKNEPCSLCGLRVDGRRDDAGRCRHCTPQNGTTAPAPQAPAVPVARRRHRQPQPPRAAALCRRCGIRLNACYPGQQLHPLCDPNPQGWTDAQLDEWTARAEARRAQKETPA